MDAGSVLKLAAADSVSYLRFHGKVSEGYGCCSGADHGPSGGISSYPICIEAAVLPGTIPVYSIRTLDSHRSPSHAAVDQLEPGY